MVMDVIWRVATVVKDGVFIVLKYVVCLCKGCDVMDVVFSICIVKRGAVGARVWEVRVFRHEYAVCLCLGYILWLFSMLHST